MKKPFFPKESKANEKDRQRALALWRASVQAAESDRKKVQAMWNAAVCSGHLPCSKEIFEYKCMEPAAIEHDAKKGNGVACFVYGCELIDGERVPVDESRGTAFILTAAEKGVPEAQMYLALRCLRNASEQGYKLPTILLKVFDALAEKGAGLLARTEPDLPANPSFAALTRKLDR